MKIRTDKFQAALDKIGLESDWVLHFADGGMVTIDEPILDRLFFDGYIMVDGTKLKFRDDAKLIALFNTPSGGEAVPVDLSKFDEGADAEALVLGKIIQLGHALKDVTPIGYLVKHGDTGEKPG